MKLAFWSSGNKRQEPEPISYTTEFRNFMQNNAPADFEDKFAKARPYLFASFLAWPMVWLYKGLDWGAKRHMSRLSVYIDRTFLQAKMVQIAIIATGIFVATIETTQPTFLSNISFKAEQAGDEENHELGDVTENIFEVN